MNIFTFASPWMLTALLALPAIWWLLRLTPPCPNREMFPPLKILAKVLTREETPAKSPWWLTALRMALAAIVILAIADPVFNPRPASIVQGGPLVVFMDNGFASAPDWQQRVQTVQSLIDEAEGDDTPVSLVLTAEATLDATPDTAARAREKLNAATARPLMPDRARAFEALRTGLNNTRPGTLAFVSDSAATEGDAPIAQKLATLKPEQFRLIEGGTDAVVAIDAVDNGTDGMRVSVTRLAGPQSRLLSLSALDAQGRVIADGSVRFEPNQNSATGVIAAPFEMRNDFNRLRIGDGATAGAVHLLDDGFKRRRVALVAGETRNDFQPLLSPLYYVERALSPFADMVQSKSANLAVSIPELLQSNPSVMILTDVGRLPDAVYEPLQQWINKGGILIRFAGPRLASAPADDPLIPVRLRQGERSLGGALSWNEPQALADFPANSPFADLAKPNDVTITRQVLAEPDPDLAERTWASLADGTPLVTTKPMQEGRIVLFHTSDEATWSNLPLSGTFVEMLRHLVQLSRSASAVSGTSSAPQTLPPFRLLTANGTLSTETRNAKPLMLSNAKPPVADFEHPPGLYGAEDGFTALNLVPEDTRFTPIDVSNLSLMREELNGGNTWPAKPWLLSAAFMVLMIDSLIVLLLNGAFSRLPRGSSGAAAKTVVVMLVAGCALMMPGGAPRADDSKPGDNVIFQRLDRTHLAYVITGEPDVDRISERGLAGLTESLTYRTTLEPGPPVGLNLAEDELAFYPMIYWPISATAPMPSDTAINRIDSYMRSGGTVLFDTRDQNTVLEGDGATISANSERLQDILSGLDIPPLEPVPSDHVLTKSFFLLRSFPGRFSGGKLWIEARQDVKTGENTSGASGDGVSSIMITGNDFAGAWAIDESGTPLLPMVSQDDMQREYAYRTGINIMMYMLTGNYKTDQVHIPELLKRLGQ